MTTKTELTNADGWTQLATADDSDVFIENQGNQEVTLAYDTDTPSAEIGHPLPGGAGTIRLAPGAIYARNPDKTGVAVLVVSK